MTQYRYVKKIFTGAALLATLVSNSVDAEEPRVDSSLPRLIKNGDRHALEVGGRPFLMLGAQVQNSSNYISVLPKVWPTIRALHANTVEVPVAWEQVEPKEGEFDFSFVDALLSQARANGVKVVLLWFGTWKNAAPTYAPEWVKIDTRRFPRMTKQDGTAEQSFSPHGRETLAADKRAFVRLMEHLRTTDRQHTVVMIQPENEVGSLGTPRDFSSTAQRLFDGPVPLKLTQALRKPAGTWKDVFGEAADQFFNAWYIASYVDEIAAAGKSVLNLPMYCNAALTDPFEPSKAGGGAIGGPNWNVIDIWKTAAPHIDLVAPDIYNRRQQAVAAILDLYARPDNALMVPEIGNAAEFARFFWLTLGRGAIGFSPFGMDGTGFSNYPLGAQVVDEETFQKFAEPYALFAPMARDWAKVALNHPTWGFAKGDDAADQSKTMGKWTVSAEYGLWESKERTDPRMLPHPNLTQPVGGAVVAQLGPDEFLVAGTDVRIRFKIADNPSTEYLSVEEGTYRNGAWTTSRRWNGDQTDFGLNFVHPVMLRVQLHSYR